MSDPTENLLSEFPEHTYDQWHAAAEALLKGASFEKLLVSKTYEGITIQPIYMREDIANLEHRKHFPGDASLVRGSHPEGFLKTGWEVSQELNACSPEKFNRMAHEGLSGGQSELNIASKLVIGNLDDMMVAFKGIEIDAISTYWHSNSNCIPAAAYFFAAAQQNGILPGSLRGCFGNDPLADLVTNSEHENDLAVRFDQMAALTEYCSLHAPGIRSITVQGDIYHNCGATATQELGYVIATLVCYIEEMKARGLSPESVMPHIRICLAVGSDYFMEISKIRATRWLWSKITTAYGVKNAPIHIHVNTSKWNKTAYDAHTNMLRVTAEAFAAVVAGADSMHIGPFDEISGHTDEFSRRIARNVHTILREECGLDHVIDPAGGSTYIEWLTDQVAAKSWGIFQDIEKQGGMLVALENGSVQKAVEIVCLKKFQNIRSRKDKILGSNIYPNLKENKLDMASSESCEKKPEHSNEIFEVGITPSASSTMIEQAINAALAGATATQISNACGITPSRLKVTPLKPRRAAEEYEALRDASAAFVIKSGTAPAILQLNIGPSRNYRVRADWTASFFEAAGFAVDGVREFLTQEDAVSALKSSKADIAVIISDDATYLEVVVPLAAALKACKRGLTLLVASVPGANEATWRAAGVDDFVNVQSNNYELNQQLLKIAGV